MIHNISRFIAALAIILLTAQGAWAQLFTTYPFKPTITYDGVNASDVTFSLTGGGVSNQALSNGQNFNVNMDNNFFYPTSFTITCSNPNGLDLQVNYSGKVNYGFSESNITFTTIDCYGSTFNLNNMKVYGNQYIAVTITVRANTSHDVNLPTGLTGGSITSNKSNPVTTAETVTLTAVPGSGYLPTSISATRHNGGAAVGVDWDGSFDNTATFAMPGDAVDVSASFTNVWTAAGGLFAKIPKNNATRSVTIPSGVTSFKVYGPSGSSAKTSYVNLEQGKLLLTAPDGCIIKLTGDILANGLFDIYVYDGNSTSSAKIGSYFGNTSGNEALPDNVVSTGNTMLITTMSEMNGLSAGLDLTAVVINTSGATTVTIIPAQEGGTVTADKTPAEYSFGETVTLSVTPDAGYLPGAISVTDESGNAVNVVGSSFTNSLTFTMPATNVTVTPTFTTTWTADGGLFANMPATGSATVTIPNGVASFNVYDDGGLNRVVRPNCNGILTLTAPDGCKIRLTGDIYSEPGDVLSVYDGANISGTVLLNEFYSAFSYESIGTHVSTGESMTLKFVTDAHENNDGLRLISTVLYPVNVASSIEHGTVTADKAHAAAGETVTLDHHSEGYVFLGYTATGVTLSGSATSFTMPASDVTIGAEWADPADFSVNDAGTEFTIHTATGWGAFCDRLAADGGKDFFSGKTVKLGADISVTQSAGGEGHEFTGTFDGGGHTLTVNYANTDNNTRTAPFSYVDGATIQNLIVGGTISGTAYRAAGIIGETVNTTSHITNCVSSVDISSGRYTGGFSIGGNVEIEGCVFNGKINGTDKSGGFVGYSNTATAISNSLFAPQDGSSISGGTFYYNGGGDVAPVNSYYTQALGTAQGKACHSVTAGDNVTIGAIALTGTATQYTVSGITAYSGGGLQRGETLYYGIDDQLNLTLSNSATGAPQGYQYGYTASAGTLSGTTLTMPDQDVTISVALAPIDWATVNQGNSADPYMIYNKDQLLLLAHRVNGTNDETANTYHGKYFKLGADITFTHPDNEGDDYAENYEAIGGDIGGYDRFFEGDFDGDGYTVSGIRIRKDGSGNADYYQGLFGRIASGANIHDVHLTDACITGYKSVGGIAGYNTGEGGYISGCSVTDSYITATRKSNYGTICGSTSNTDRLTNNYYHGCTVNGTPITSGVGCYGADITDNNGALPAYRLDLGANITTPPGTFAGQTGWLDTPPVSPRLAPENGFTLAGNHYFASGYVFTPGSTLASGAAQGYTPRATLDDVLLTLYTPTGDAPDYTGTAIARFTITADCDGKTLASTEAIYSTGQPVTVAYIKADGTTDKASAIALDGHETVDGNGDVRLAAGTYYVGTDIAYANQIVPDGDITLILADGKTMTLNGNTTGILTDGYNLTIYGQSLVDDAGTLRYDGTSDGIDVNNYVQHSGNVSITTGFSAFGIEASVTLLGGTLTVTADGTGACAISGRTHSILGGHLTATATGTGATGIYTFASSSTITLGWTRPADRITASSIRTYGGTVAVADGQALTDGSGHIYTGTLSASVLSGFAAETTLQPCLALADAADNTAAITDHAGKTLAVALSGRTLYKDGSWNTLCLPFAVDLTASGTLSGDNVQAMTLNTSSSTFADGTLTLNFTAAETIPAGTPFIIKWDVPSDDYEAYTGQNAATCSDLVSPVFLGVTIDAENRDATVEDVLTFTGTYAPVPIPATGDNTKLYLGAANKLYYPTKSMTIGTHRAYFQLLGDLTAGEPTSPQPSGVRAFNLNFFDEQSGEAERGDDEATGIISVHDSGFTVNGSAAWYTLDGRCLDGQPTAKGLYIHGGKKVIVK